MTPYTRERIENWAADFASSDAVREFPAPARDAASPVVGAFLMGACQVRGVEPEEVEEADLRASLLGPVSRLSLSEGVAAHIPLMCGAFLDFLESEGRLGGGRMMGAFVRALGASFRPGPGGKPKPIVRPGTKLSPNGPCPCGSGRKYKKCCMT